MITPQQICCRSTLQLMMPPSLAALCHHRSCAPVSTSPSTLHTPTTHRPSLPTFSMLRPTHPPPHAPHRLALPHCRLRHASSTLATTQRCPPSFSTRFPIARPLPASVLFRLYNHHQELLYPLARKAIALGPSRRG